MILAKGTKVTLKTKNGGDAIVTLYRDTEICSDGLPNYPLTVTSAFGHDFTVMPTRVKSITPVA